VRERGCRGHADRGYRALRARRPTSWNERDHARAGSTPHRIASTARAPLASRSAAWRGKSERKARDESAGPENACSEASPASMRSSASSWVRPSHPVAISGGVGTADDTLTSASGPRRRTEGNVTPPSGLSSLAKIIPPGLRKAMLGSANIGVVIAGDHRDTIGCADAFQPFQRWRKFCFEREIDKVACDRDVIRSFAPACPTPAHRARSAPMESLAVCASS